MFLCHISDIPNNKAKSFVVGQRAIFVIRQQDQIFAYFNQCPHLGIELNWLPDQFLDRDGGLIQCSTHGALFIIDTGECVAGPCLGQNLQAIPVKQIDREIHLIEPL